MRQFIVEKGKIKNGLLVLDGKDFRYFRQVLRVRTGDMITLRLPEGNISNATVAQIDEGARKITLQLCASTDDDGQKEIAGVVKPKVEYWLFQFLPRPQKFELIVRQATECGVSVIVPILGEYSEKSSAQSIMGSKRERLERIVKEARQQSGSPIETKVLEPVSLEKALELWKGDLAFVLSERDDCDGNLRSAVEKAAAHNQLQRAAIAVGSEGGISPAEVQLLSEKGLFTPIHFAVNILRCETAALYGIAAVQSEINQVGKNGN